MSEIVTAVFENGVLRPSTPLPLRELEEVRIKLLRSDPVEDVEAVLRELAHAGIVTAPSDDGKIAPMSSAKRLENARTLGNISGKSLSQLIIDDRGD